MKPSENHPDQVIHFDRRQLLRSSLAGMGAWAAAGSGLSWTQGDPARPLDPKMPHFRPQAKRVLFLCMRGAPSHVDTFDYKPALTKATGQSGPVRGTLMGSPWTFKQHGESGLWLSELFPHLADHADELCVVNGMHCDQPNHPQAQTQMHTGNFQFVRPSLGSWVLFGLGTENPELPGFVTLSPFGSAQNYGSAFLPAIFQGTKLNPRPTRVRTRRGRGKASGPIPNLQNPDLTAQEQRTQLDFIQELNARALKRDPHRDDLIGMIDSNELAFSMQSALPTVLDLSAESDSTRALYGIEQGPTESFGQQCLMARRLLESGVRFVEVTHGNWDHHRNLTQALGESCEQIDRPISGLLTDLKQRGLLEDTLVLWGGEFGRTPHSQNGNGRDHNHRGYSTWMAGAGVRGGIRHGATDELGYEAVEKPMHIHDWHATILHLLGLDHERLTYPYAGREFRLTDVQGQVHNSIFS